MRAFTAAAALAGSLALAPASAHAAKFVEVVPAGDYSEFSYRLPTARPVRVLVSGHFPDVTSDLYALVDRSEIGCFHYFDPGCWYYSELIYEGGYSLSEKGIDVIFDVDENGDCDPYTPPPGEFYSYCDYRGIRSIELGIQNYGEKPIKFTVKLAVVPEPSTWALMIVGFGTAGAYLRRRRLAG